jgi:hypothetical protein
MPRTGWTPTIVRNDGTVYLVVDNFYALGRVYRETDVDQADFETVVEDLRTGQYNDPIRVIAFNAAKGWAQDVSGSIARELRRRADIRNESVSSSVRAFVEQHAGPDRQLTLRLA